MAEHGGEIDRMQAQLQQLRQEVAERDQQLRLLQDELDTAKEANSRAPTATMKKLVERLRNELALKEKQQQVRQPGRHCAFDCIFFKFYFVNNMYMTKVLQRDVIV